MPLDPFFVHETAVVEDGALVGRGSQVWHHAQVRAGATLLYDSDPAAEYAETEAKARALLEALDSVE